MTILFLCFFPLRRYLNHSSQYLSTFLNTSKFVKNTQYASYFQLSSQCLEMWWNTVFRVRYSISKTWPCNWIVFFVKLFYKKSRFFKYSMLSKSINKSKFFFQTLLVTIILVLSFLYSRVIVILDSLPWKAAVFI